VDGTPTKMTVGRALRNNKQDGSPSSNKRFDGQFMVLLVPDNFVFTPPEKHTSALCKKVPNDVHIAYAQFNYLNTTMGNAVPNASMFYSNFRNNAVQVRY